MDLLGVDTDRHALSWVSLGFLGLAIAVFSWGIGYKLSLYDPPQATSRQMPQAKLLSKDEQAPAHKKMLADHTEDLPGPSDLWAPIAFLLFCILPAFSVWDAYRVRQGERKKKHTWRAPHRAGLNFFFVLPPPILA